MGGRSPLWPGNLVGMSPYDEGSTGPGASLIVESLAISFRVKTPELKPGMNGIGEVTLSNITTQVLDLLTNLPILGKIVDMVTLEPLGRYGGAIAGVGMPLHLEASGSVRLPVLFGTTPHGPTAAALKPGRYLVRADLALYRPADGDRLEQVRVALPTDVVTLLSVL